MVEVIQKIRTAEENAEEMRKACRLAAAQLRDDAAEDGRRLVERRAADAAAESASILGRAERESAARLDEARQESKNLCDELSGAAGARLERAADFIVERIVGGL
ncbi:MAG: hypothetical protein LBU86_05310 [Oscillospiraceae bacterium]|nr:hypothetical protein [Oscillospiraceae bacterium]